MSSTIPSPAAPNSAVLWDDLRRYAKLPTWLTAAATLALVAAALNSEVPEFASGTLVLLGCDLERLRLKRGYWVGPYQLTVAPAGGTGEPRQVDVEGRLYPPGALPQLPDQQAVAFGTDGWRQQLPELGLDLRAEPAAASIGKVTLPSMPVLTDPVAARELLETIIRAASPAYADLRLAACTPRVVRYKPGSRATIVYRLEYPPGTDPEARGWPDVVIAKTFRGDKGANAWAGMRSLWESPLGRGGAVRIAEPLGYLPDRAVLLQGPVGQERTLKELIRAALDAGTPEMLGEADTYVAKTGVGLAALHTSGASIGKPVTIDDKLAELHEVADILGVNVPELAGAADGLLAGLEALAAAHPADPPVPSHGSFRPDQVLLSKGGIGFVDFDAACHAEPARDLGLFRATIKDVGLTRKAEDGVPEPPRAAQLATYERLDRLTDDFLAAYLEVAPPVSPMRLLLWETAEVLDYALSCWRKVKPEKLAANMLMLERQVNGPLEVARSGGSP
jgi:Phosphotransferase enzyme family